MVSSVNFLPLCSVILFFVLLAFFNLSSCVFQYLMIASLTLYFSAALTLLFIAKAYSAASFFFQLVYAYYKKEFLEAFLIKDKLIILIKLYIK